MSVNYEPKEPVGVTDDPIYQPPPLKRPPVKASQVYGIAWEVVKKHLGRYLWRFDVPQEGERYVWATNGHTETYLSAHMATDVLETTQQPRIIIDRDFVKETYGVYYHELTAPEGTEFTGEFRVPRAGDYGVLMYACKKLFVLGVTDSQLEPLPNVQFLILRKKRPATPQLLDCYGTDTVTVPEGMRWNGEFVVPDDARSWLPRSTPAFSVASRYSSRRLILEPTQPREIVEFVAEEKVRMPKKGDWFWDSGHWKEALADFQYGRFFCVRRVTRTEPTPAYTLTQDDIDRYWNKGGKPLEECV